MEEWLLSLPLDVDNCLGVDTIIAEVFRCGLFPSVKLIADGEEIRYSGILLFGCRSHLRVERTQSMFGEDFLCFFCKEELDKCFRHLTCPMLIHIDIHDRHWILDQNCGSGNY